MPRYLTPSALADVRDQAAERLQRRRPRNAARVRRYLFAAAAVGSVGSGASGVATAWTPSVRGTRRGVSA